MGPPSVIRSGTGLAGPPRAGAMAVLGAATALEDCLQAVVCVSWLSPGTRPPWSGSSVERISCGALPRGYAGRSPSPRDDTRTHGPLATGGTPLGMGVPTLGTHRLPVQTQGDLYGRLPKRRAADGEGRGVRRVIQPIAPHRTRLGYRDMEEPPLQKVRHGQRHPLGRGGPRVGICARIGCKA